MTSAPAPAPARDDTLDQFLDSDEGRSFEYVNGHLKESVMSIEASEANGLISYAITGHTLRTGAGSTLGQDAGVRIWPDPSETRRGDTLFVRSENIPPPGTTFLLTPPDLVVEVVSLHDRASEVRDKVNAWLEGGVLLVWVAFPMSREVQVFRRGAHPRFLTADDELDGEDVLPGFRIQVARLFPHPDEAFGTSRHARNLVAEREPRKLSDQLLAFLRPRLALRPSPSLRYAGRSMVDARDIRQHLEDLVGTAARRAIAAGDLPDVVLPGAAIERPKDLSRGDFASTVPMRLARAAMLPPLKIAEALARHLPADPAIESPQVAAPGFLNVRLSDAFVQDQVEHIIAHGQAFADLELGAGRKAQVEFVSANPTGPLHVGNGRGAAIGDALASVLQAAGYEVEREYYVNDAGTQTDMFAETLYARYQQLFGREVPVPADGYPGQYMVEVAQAIKDEAGDAFLRPEGEPAPAQMDWLGIELMVRNIRQSLSRFGVNFDRWFSEKALYDAEGTYETALAVLREKGYLVQREGALWFNSSELGEDKDNVVIRSDGRPTYYASDIAYHYDKFLRRGFSLVVNVWGADHHGHVSRLKTATRALGGDSDGLHVLLYQLVTLKRGAEIVRLSKRSGEIISLDELIDEVGADAARFFFLLRSPGAQMDFDLELAVKQSSDNPVYYVQYAHARLASILERAHEQGLSAAGGDVRLLTGVSELALIREMMRLPEVIESAATSLEPQQLPHYAMSLANAFHAFNDAFKQQNDSSMKVITDDADLTRARLRLVLAAKIALARVLGLMGMTAPERM